MSAAEIADNKWEREAAKPPVASVGAIAQLALVSVFILIFLWILSWTVMGIVGDKKSTMADKYGEMQAGDAAPAKK